MFLSLILPVGFHCCYKNKSTGPRIDKSLCKSRVPGSSLSHTRLCSTLWACSKAITSGYVTLIICVFIWNPTVIRCPIFVVPNADPPTGICTSQFLEYNTRCTFTCRAGFRLKGCKERVCQLDKSWSGKHTSCEGMYDTGIIMTHIVLNSTLMHSGLFLIRKRTNVIPVGARNQKSGDCSLIFLK